MNKQNNKLYGLLICEIESKDILNTNLDRSITTNVISNNKEQQFQDVYVSFRCAGRLNFHLEGMSNDKSRSH